MLARRTILGLAAASSVAAIVQPAAAAAPQGLKSLVDSRVSRFMATHACPSVVVGVFDSRDRYVLGAGNSGQADGRSPSGDTVYQLGSITKTFTGLAVAQDVAAGTRSFDDPLAKYLPTWMPVPTWPGRLITLGDVVTHTSGLPSIPADWVRRLELLTKVGIPVSDPWALFTVQDMADALRTITLTRSPGTKFEYSNFAMGLLGQSLAVGTERSCEKVIGPRIAEPLGLRDTCVALSPQQLQRKAVGHDTDGAPTPDWHTRTISAAGALYGTVDDLLRYLKAQVELTPTALTHALTQSHHPRFSDGKTTIAVNWLIEQLPSTGRHMLWHNGGTGGFRGFCGFCPTSRTGIAALTNSGNDAAGANLETMAISLLDAIS